ncbi:MAG: hypothetical protein M3R62_14755, partial [Acidobacteriota bacterium]|nr:hypothetical protein [Acidobacteriota bacterium]
MHSRAESAQDALALRSGLPRFVLQPSSRDPAASDRGMAAMKTFERLYLCAEPFLPPLYRKVRGRLLQLSSGDGRRGSILDVGGRKSHYTIGIPADVTIGELPRHTEVQNELNLGINDTIRELILARRSNVRDVLYDDMTKSALPDAAFDCVV